MTSPNEEDSKPELPIEVGKLSRVQSRARSSCLTVSTISTPEGPVVLHGRDQRRGSEGKQVAFLQTYDIEKSAGRVESNQVVPSSGSDVQDHESCVSSTTQVEQEPNLVDWEGSDDPKHPQNWKRQRKWIAIAIVSALTFMSPLTSSILAPSLPAIGEDLNVPNDLERTLCLSVFVLGFAFGPLVLAPLSELYGRAIVLQLSNAWFAVFNLACAFAPNKEAFILFRFFAGIGGSAPLAIGPAVLSDLFTADERGTAVSIYTFFPLMGPALGPICGGFIADYTTWRWCFWATTIATVPILILGVLYLEETYPPVLLQRKRKMLVASTGNQELFTSYDQPDLTLGSKIADALIRPLKLMTTQIIVIVMGLYQAYLYGLMYIVLATFPRLWTERYHQSLSMGGLNYISLGLGYCVGIQISARVQDRIYAVLKQRNNGVGSPEYRIPMMIPIAVILPLGFFIYGWTAEKHTHWIFPNIGAFIFAAGIMVGFNALMTYVVDSYPTYCASASAAISLLRSCAAFALPLSAPAMYESLGYGWGNSLLAFVAIGIGGPAPILLWMYGAKLRAASTFASG